MAVFTITIEGAPPYDGTYPIDFDQALNGRELHLIKQASGVRMGEISEALEAGDFDLIVAFAAIALTRAGKVEKAKAQQALQLLLETEMGKITFNAEVDEADPQPAPSDENKPSGTNETSTSSSVVSLPTGDGRPATNLPRTGTPA